jgi:hypothetical protein
VGTRVRKTESSQVSKSADPLEWEVLSFKLSTRMGLTLGRGRDYMKLDVRLDCIFIIESPISNNSKGQTSLQSMVQFFIRDGLDDQVH